MINKNVLCAALSGSQNQPGKWTTLKHPLSVPWNFAGAKQEYFPGGFWNANCENRWQHKSLEVFD
jgi:hypothetical protein